MSVDQNGGASPASPPLSSDPAQLEREIEERRARLAATVDELVVRAHPKEIARRGADDAKAKLRAAVTTPEGDLRRERVGAAAAVVALFVLFAVWNRRRRS